MRGNSVSKSHRVSRLERRMDEARLVGEPIGGD